MSQPNGTLDGFSSFILVGLPGMEAAQFWLAFPLCAMYVVAVVGNCAMMFVVKTEPALHVPMYFFLSMLAAADLALSTCTVPKILSFFWFGAREIGYEACLVQMFLIHSLSGVESTILLAMAVDRYVAICHPLQHSAILTNSRTAKIGLVAVVRGALFFLPFPLLINRLPFCGSNTLTHSYCVHQDVMHLGCGDGLTAILAVMGLDSLLIFMTYVLILKTVLQLASRQERLRASGTCVAHLCVVLAFYVPLIGLSVVHRFRRDLPPLVHVTMGNFYLLVPPLFNPVVYAARTKEIQRRALKAMKIARNRDFP
ncbi:PREDICTED: olfactory receptor 51E2-like [Gekko japonicus]|uniref:Olfactory receptor n=1 Tax=Gekko japonicus TaxID=146911 RepID=A0ABM1JSH2_GEKJA|nr:PREDICTED: olfactory receptor 51E2-like [Gekko japonicus]